MPLSCFFIKIPELEKKSEINTRFEYDNQNSSLQFYLKRGLLFP